jgi:Spy/CpxP family protein refolding chaperone
MTFRTCLSTAAIVLVTTATLYAQSPVPPVQGPAAVPPVTARAHKHHHKANWQDFVALTPAQRQQVRPMQKAFQKQKKSFRAEEHTQVTSLLTNEQRARLASMQSETATLHLKNKNSGAQRLPKGWKKVVGLSPEQKQQMKAMHQQVKSRTLTAQNQFLSQLQPILTPEQKSRLDQFMQSHHGRV